MTSEEKVWELEEILKDISEISYKCLGEWQKDCLGMLDEKDCLTNFEIIC